MSNVRRRKLHFQQLENALGTSLPAVIKGYATLRDAKLAESSYDKVVRHDETNRCCVCASWFGWVHWHHKIFCCEAGCTTVYFRLG